MLRAVLSARIKDRTIYLRHDEAIASKMVRAMTKSRRPTPLSVGTIYWIHVYSCFLCCKNKLYMFETYCRSIFSAFYGSLNMKSASTGGAALLKTLTIIGV